MTTIYTKSQALNVWNSQTGTDNLRVDMVAGSAAGTFESRIAHSNLAAGTYQPVQFPGPLVFFDGSNRHVLVDRFAAVDTAISSLSTNSSDASSLVASNLAIEITRAGLAEVANTNAISAENGRAISAEGAISASLAQELLDRAFAETGLSNRIDNEVTARSSADTVHSNAIIRIEGKVDAEVLAARAAELVLTNAIAANSSLITAEEKSARDAETALGQHYCSNRPNRRRYSICSAIY